jgi:hypothetical protein
MTKEETGKDNNGQVAPENDETERLRRITETPLDSEPAGLGPHLEYSKELRGIRCLSKDSAQGD